MLADFGVCMMGIHMPGVDAGCRSHDKCMFVCRGEVRFSVTATEHSLSLSCNKHHMRELTSPSHRQPRGHHESKPAVQYARSIHTTVLVFWSTEPHLTIWGRRGFPDHSKHIPLRRCFGCTHTCMRRPAHPRAHRLVHSLVRCSDHASRSVLVQYGTSPPSVS